MPAIANLLPMYIGKKAKPKGAVGGQSFIQRIPVGHGTIICIVYMVLKMNRDSDKLVLIILFDGGTNRDTLFFF
jgi:hypothetical protein